MLSSQHPEMETGAMDCGVSYVHVSVMNIVKANASSRRCSVPNKTQEWKMEMY